jgi:hypothetical protein
MPRTGLYAILWTAFTLLTLAGGYAMLRACDLGIVSLFGASACVAPPSDMALAAERERQDHLRANLHSAEVRLAQLPICPTPPKPKPKPTPIVEPKPQPGPDKQDRKPDEKLTTIQKVEELKGCWQSSTGDIELIKDDGKQTPAGKARFCYCFGADGSGILQVRYTDGDICRGPLTAEIKPGQVFMRHGTISCQTHGGQNAEEISCPNGLAKETTCETHVIGKFNDYKIKEQYIRVSDEYCGWKG